MEKRLSPSTLARTVHALAALLGLDLVRGPPLRSAKLEAGTRPYWTARPKPEAMGYATEKIGPIPEDTLRVRGVCAPMLPDVLDILEELEAGKREEHLARFAAWIPSMSRDRIVGVGYTLDHAIGQAAKPLIDTDFPPETEIEAALMTEELSLAVRRDGMDAVRWKLRGGSISLVKKASP